MLHQHPVLIGSESMDQMIIENSSKLLNRITNNKIKGVAWGHIHNEISINYNGRKSEENRAIHTGSMQMRAFF